MNVSKVQQLQYEMKLKLNQYKIHIWQTAQKYTYFVRIVIRNNFRTPYTVFSDETD